MGDSAPHQPPGRVGSQARPPQQGPHFCFHCPSEPAPVTYGGGSFLPSYIPINRDWGPFRVGSGRTASSTVLPEGFIFCRRPIPRPVLTELSPLWPSCAPPQAPGRNCTRSLRGLHAERPYLWVEWTYAPRTTAPAPGPAPASGCRGSAVLDVSQESRRAALPVRGSWVLLRRSDAVSSLSP